MYKGSNESSGECKNAHWICNKEYGRNDNRRNIHVKQNLTTAKLEKCQKESGSMFAWLTTDVGYYTSNNTHVISQVAPADSVNSRTGGCHIFFDHTSAVRGMFIPFPGEGLEFARAAEVRLKYAHKIHRGGERPSHKDRWSALSRSGVVASHSSRNSPLSIFRFYHLGNVKSFVSAIEGRGLRFYF
jgi:hypothetical protein